MLEQQTSSLMWRKWVLNLQD